MILVISGILATNARLFHAEWIYLFDTRTVNGGTGNDKSYTLGQSVNGKLGIVIYPDDYTGATYSGSDWSTFEAAGCVFLPAAGFCASSSVNSVGSEGNYWTSSSDAASNVHYVQFSSSSLNTTGSVGRDQGYSVRLVRDVE